MALTAFKIPFTTDSQSFNIALDGNDYIFENKWNAQGDYWEINIYDGDTDLPIICGLPLVTGSNLLIQFPFLPLKGKLIVYTDGSPDTIPDLNSLGNNSNVYYLTSLPQ